MWQEIRIIDADQRGMQILFDGKPIPEITKHAAAGGVNVYAEKFLSRVSIELLAERVVIENSYPLARPGEDEVKDSGEGSTGEVGES
jgi:hypothetical protein